MANWDPRSTAAAAAASAGTQADVRDAGLRKYMLSVYNTMASGVLLTGIVALLFAQSGLAAQVLSTPLRWLILRRYFCGQTACQNPSCRRIRLNRR